MIPLKLQIKNFVSYGQKTQTINFEPYNLICLSGRNGHGKSALLDALTWCVWGNARKISGVAKADEGLMRLGQSNMMVCLDFKCNNQDYRIKREYTITNAKSYTHLEFGVIDKDSEQFRSLTDKTIRATQAKIEKTLGIDYDSFINSAFLRQGQSNEFSKKTPRDRKEILASILGLNKFEELRKRAQEKYRESQSKRDNTQQFIEQCLVELKEKEIIKSELQEIKNTLQTLLEQENILKAQILQTKSEQEILAQKKTKVQQATFEKNQLQSNIAQLTNQFTEDSTKFRILNKKIRKLSEIKDLEQNYQSIKTRLKALQDSQIKQIQLKELSIELKEKINIYLEQLQKTFTQNLQDKKTKQQEVIYQLKTYQDKISEYQATKLSQDQDIEKIKTDLINFEKTTANLTSLTTQQEKEELQFDKRKAFYHKFIAQKNWLTSELQNITNKKNIIKNNDNPQCPLCEQSLESNGTNKLCTTLENQEYFYNYRLKRIINITAKLKNILVEQHKNLEKIKNQIDQTNALEIKKIELKNKQHQLTEHSTILKSFITEIQSKMASENAKITQINQEINTLESSQQKNILTDKNYQEQLIKLDKINQELKETNYDPALEKELTKQIDSLEQYRNQQTNLLQEFALQEQRKKNVSLLNQQIKEIKKKLNAIDLELAQNAMLAYQESELNKKIENLRYNTEQIFEKKEILIHKKGALEQQNKNLEEQEKKHIQLKELLKVLEKEIEEYKAISTALSKDGIQALLIEDALPEIEQEANYLLSKLTDNQAQLSFDSLRDLRNGNTKETLDIKISDSMGIRPYELFSGGEAFRIDFALRIAISKLLARKAGTALQTLIIDEGFGSQDEDGLANIMQAIYKIQDDFSKVIIVSHLQSLKEQFPINFIVQKGPEGSTVSVIEQD